MADWANPIKVEETPPPESTTRQADFKPLRELPVPVELLILATSYMHAAHSLTPLIARGARDGSLYADEDGVKDEEMEDDELDELESENDNDDENKMFKREKDTMYADQLSTYRRYISAAIMACSSAVKLGGPDLKLNLRARLMLAELLVKETEEREKAEEVIARALAISTKHESLADYTFRFRYLQLELALETGNIKYAKTATRKIILELQQDFPTWYAWTYRFQLLYIRICSEYEHDLASALSSLAELEEIAKARQHKQLHWVTLNMRARLALLKGDIELAGTIITELAAGYKLPVTNSDVPEPDEKRMKSFEVIHDDLVLRTLPDPLVLHFLILLTVYQAHCGHSTAARQNIRRAQYLLDKKPPGKHDVDGQVTLYIPPTNSVPSKNQRKGQSLIISTVPRRVFYVYTFLISTVVQIDPVGKSPKCLHYAEAGLERLSEMLMFDEEDDDEEDSDVEGDDAELQQHFACGPVGTVEQTVKRVASIRIDLMLIQGEMLLMRSSLEELHDLILELVDFTRAYGLWGVYNSQILILQGMFAAFLGDLDRGFKYYAAALEWLKPESHLAIVARASILFLRLAQGYKVRLNASEGHTSSPTPKRISLPFVEAIKEETPLKKPVCYLPSPELESNEDLEAFAKDILKDCNETIPSLKTIKLLVEAVVYGEISRAKRDLSVGLDLSSHTNNQHIKPLILALLACQFSNTRNDQAQKMLHIAHTISITLGGIDKNKDKVRAEVKPEHGTEAAAQKPGGLAKLALWAGEQLLEIYREDKLENKVNRQEGYNERHRRALALQLDLLGRAF